MHAYPVYSGACMGTPYTLKPKPEFLLKCTSALDWLLTTKPKHLNRIFKIDGLGFRV